MNQVNIHKLSATIITLNEERNIERCIQSLQSIADEIIVVDSFSTDKTKEICQKYKVNFIERKWEGYSKTKNYANSLAKHDYIFSIDADEAVSEELKQFILIEKQKGFQSNAYRMNRLTNYCGQWIKHCGWYPDEKTRIWNKNLGKWEGQIHETIVFEANTSFSKLKGDLLHYSYHNLSDHLRQIKLFTDLAAKQNIQEGKRGSSLKLIFSPIVKFFSMYFLKLGILDGYYGFRISLLSGYGVFLKHKKTLFKA